MKSFLTFKIVNSKIFLYFQKILTQRLWQDTQFTTAIWFCFILTTYRGEYNVILRDSEPIRLLESPRSLSVYILKTRYNIQTIFKSNEHMLLYFRFLCKEIQDSLDSGFHAVDSGFQALGITLLNELTKPPD